MTTNSVQVDLREAIGLAVEAAQQAGSTALDMQSSLVEVRFKGEKDVVTEADLECDKIIRSKISAAFPHHNLVTEELKNLDQGSPYTWYVDPIDGTVNYSRGIPLWAVSIGLAVRGRLVAGVVHLPVTRETFTAIRGEGAWRGESRIRVSDKATLRDALVSHGDFNVGATPEEKRFNNERYLNARRGFATAAQRVKCLGSAAMEACFVACGRLDAYCVLTFKTWDVAASALLVEEAGGRVSTAAGETWSLDSKSALFTNGLIHREALDVLANATSGD